MAAKDPITCHVLDTLSGRPAAGMKVNLSCKLAPDAEFTSSTNADGRITSWTPLATFMTLGSLVAGDVRLRGPEVWTLTFDTGAYYGEGNTFWPQVELSFYVKPGEHYHVPLLLGPYSYTTYRGS